MEEKTKLDWLAFEPLFGSWSPRFKDFFFSGGFDPIYEFLKKESKRGIQIAPKSENVFRAFKETSINDLKVIIVGMAPYHTFYNNEPIADGLCLSCGITKRLQPSLENWYLAMEQDIGRGLVLNMVKDPDLIFLARQGCLLLNMGLTVSKGKPGNMNTLWEPFMKYLFEEVLVTNGVPVILLGKEASKLKRYIMPFTWIFELSHPASASYQNIQWSSNQTFTKVNQILKENNNNVIQWFKTE